LQSIQRAEIIYCSLQYDFTFETRDGYQRTCVIQHVSEYAIEKRTLHNMLTFINILNKNNSI